MKKILKLCSLALLVLVMLFQLNSSALAQVKREAVVKDTYSRTLGYDGVFIGENTTWRSIWYSTYCYPGATTESTKYNLLTYTTTIKYTYIHD